MMKKSLIILTAILALTVFGTVSSAHAFIDPVSLTVILGVTMIVTVTGAEIFYHKKEALPEKGAACTEDTEAAKEVQSAADVSSGQ